jgi:hypothetical protein
MLSGARCIAQLCSVFHKAAASGGGNTAISRRRMIDWPSNADILRNDPPK